MFMFEGKRFHGRFHEFPSPLFLMTTFDYFSFLPLLSSFFKKQKNEMVGIHGRSELKGISITALLILSGFFYTSSQGEGAGKGEGQGGRASQDARVGTSASYCQPNQYKEVGLMGRG